MPHDFKDFARKHYAIVVTPSEALDPILSEANLQDVKANLADNKNVKTIILDQDDSKASLSNYQNVFPEAADAPRSAASVNIRTPWGVRGSD